MSQVAMAGENQEFLVYGLVAEEVRAALRAGRPADVETLVRDHPELAGQIRQLVPTLMLVQQMARDERDDPQSPHLPKTEVPQLLGDFRIIREIGRGGMGVVYEAEQVSLERRVALKVLPFAAVMDPRQLQRFQNEARAAASLHHTNIVPVHAVGSERGVHYYAMQYIDGVPLNVVIQELRQRRLDAADSQALLSDPDQQSRAHAAPPQAVESEPETARLRGALSTKLSATGREFFHAVARLAEQAALALDHAHERGIIHRDIKPANLLLDGAGILLITDFGLAQVQSDAKLTMTGDLLGTLRYMSPEQALAKRLIVDHRTDIYSLGATLYELLTLEPVFDGTDRQELLRQIAFDEPWPPRRLNKSIPPELEIIVGKALEKNPTDRYPTAQALADDLRRFLEDRPIQARRPSPMRRAQKWARRHKPLVGAAAVVLFMAAVLGGGSWMWWAQKRAAAEGEARAAMREAAGLLEEERWPEALSAARRAEGALLGVGADPALRRQARELIADLEMASQLQEAPLLGAPVKDGPFDADARDAAYAAAFRDYGLDVDGLDPQSAAEQVRARLIHRQLVGALDDWASARKLVKRDGWRQRLAVARAADPDAWRNRLRDALEGKDPKAVEEAATSGQVPDWPAQTFYLLGVLAHGTPAAEHAAALLQQAQQRYPNDFWINETLAVLLFESRSPYPEEAVRFSSIAVALRPQSPGARLNLGAALLDRGRLDEAIAECRVAVRLKKDYPEGHNGLGNALVNRGWLEEAISEFREAIRLKKDFPDAHNNLGNVLREKARLDEAIAECREAIRLQKDFPEAHCSLGGALREKGRLDEAIA
ncbi:MAG TPA: protein kinase, partial [Gemmataceae bacterium]|nr:protein kinase [Gemmataceae bacterium]